MQNIAVQMINRRSPKELNSASASKQKDVVSEECADPFLQIIMNMITQFQENAGNQMQGNQMQDTVGAMMAAGGITENATMMEANKLNDPQILPDLLSLLDSQDMQLGQENPMLQDIDVSDPAVPLALISQLLSGSSKTSKTDKANSQIPNLAQIINSSGTDGKKDLESFVETLGLVFEKSTDNSDSSTLSPLFAKNGFMEAVATAKETMSKSGTDTKEIELDVDTIQNEAVQRKTFGPIELGFKTTPESSGPSLIDQITTDIKQNVSLGKSEFTVKLKPESLGLITVKLVEKAGETTLSIITASAQTAKLINSDLAALKEAIAPMNVHVNEAVIQTDSSQQSNMQQFNMSGQQFAGQQFAGQQNFNGFANTSSSSGNDGYLPDEFDEVPDISPLEEAVSGLDKYI